MSFSSLAPVSAAIFGTLNVAALTALAPGGVFDVLPAQPTFPCVLFAVGEARQLGGFGTKPGVGTLPEVALRVHVFSQYEGMREAQLILAKVLELLANAPAVTGYSSWAIFHDDTTPLSDELVAGVRVQELVANFRLYVEGP